MADVKSLQLTIIKFDTIEKAVEGGDDWAWATEDWNYERWGNPSSVWAKGSKDGFHTGIPGSLTTSEPAAEYIVKACNLFPELVDALIELKEAEWMVTHDWGGDRASILNKIDELLIKAKG